MHGSLGDFCVLLYFPLFISAMRIEGGTLGDKKKKPEAKILFFSKVI